MEESQQDIVNHAPVDNQFNFAKVDGSVNLSKKSRWQKRFEKLQHEVQNDIRYSTFIDDFNTYNTILDGIGLEQKLIDGGFSEKEIIKALNYKDKYARRVVLGEMYHAQQEIDVEIFSIIDSNFSTYVLPKITKSVDKTLILECLLEKVIQPILDLLNNEGEADEYLKYNANDIYGMIYFLTGKCHLNWKDYDTVQ
jgi:hypothetical protein